MLHLVRVHQHIALQVCQQGALLRDVCRAGEHKLVDQMLVPGSQPAGTMGDQADMCSCVSCTIGQELLCEPVRIRG